MTAKKFSNALGNIGDHYIHEAIAYTATRKRFWHIGTVAALLLLSICAIGVFLLPHIDNGNIGNDIQALEPPLFFATFDEFESHQRAEKHDTPGCYYIPSNIPDGFTLNQISMREDVYITITYSTNSTALTSSDISEYAKERRGTLIYTYYLFEDGSLSLNEQFIPGGYKAFEHQGQIMYRRDAYDIADPDILVGYEIVFLLEDGHLMNIHLPPIDTFENMLQYTEVVKVNID